MKWHKIGSAGGLVIVLTFAAYRLSRVRTLWSGFSWTDMRDFGDLGLYILINATLLVAISAILWGGYLLLWKRPESRTTDRLPSITRRSLHVFELAVLSVVMALAMEGLAKMQTPGWWVASKVNKPGDTLNIGHFIDSAIVVDSALWFAALWTGYMLWTRSRFRNRL